MLIIKKSDSLLMKIMGFILYPINPRFMTNYYTTIGSTVYVPDSNEINPIVLKHEAVHVSQYEKYGLWFMFSYVFVLPFFWTYRAKWEMEAYEVSIKEFYKLNSQANKALYKTSIIDQFTSSKYGWMCINKEKVNAWYDSVVKNLE